MADDDTDCFSTGGPTSDLDRFAEQIAPLPADAAALGEVVRGLLIHNWTADMSGIPPSPERDGMRTFGAATTIGRILALDDAPLDQPRPAAERLIGFCYHFALVHCALLRAKGVPARARCGFADYLVDGKWIDHWVVEHWDGDTWRLNDPQIGLDRLSHDHFRDGVRAWRLCREGEAEPFDHGIGDLWGWDELRGSLVNDLGALNKIEVGDWEWCGLLRVDPLDQPHAAVDARLDAIAVLVGPDGSLKELHAEFARSPELRPPDDLLRNATSG